MKVFTWSVLAVSAAALSIGCRKAEERRFNPETATMQDWSNAMPKDLHEALFAPALTNRNSPEHHAFTSRVAKAIADYEQRQKK